MNFQRFKSLVKGEKKRFNEFCRVNRLPLDYRTNHSGIGILRSIFGDREYADFFPFYRKAVVVDIGAHYGYFSLFARNNAKEGSKILALEPDPDNYRRLRKNLLDCAASNVVPMHCAIGGKPGKGTLYKGLNTNNSLIDDYPLAHREAGSAEVEIITLEDLVNENKLDRIDFLKMDCEGAEYDIFEQTPPSVWDRIETLSMEFHDLKDEKATGEFLMEVLVKSGFEIVKYQYEKTSMDLNYGKLIGTRLLKRLKNGTRHQKA